MIKLKISYNKNRFISKKLCLEMENLTALVKTNLEKNQFFQYNYNKEKLKNLHKDLEFVFETQLKLK